MYSVFSLKKHAICELNGLMRGNTY